MARVRDRIPFLRVVGGAASRPPAPGERERERDEGLVEAYLRGESAALAALVRRNAPLALAIVRRWARPQDASGLVLRTLLRAVRVAGRVLRKDPPRAFRFRRSLLRACVSGAGRHLEIEMRLARARLDELGPQPELAGEADTDRRVRRVRAAVCLLPPREREALTLRLDADLPLPEIAAALDITEEAARLSLQGPARRLRATVPPAEHAALRACPEREATLSLRGLGELERAEAARLGGHLAGCAGCRAEADAIDQVLACAALAPVSDAERGELDRLPDRALAALERRERRRTIGMTILVATIVAVLSAALAASVLLRTTPFSPDPGSPEDLPAATRAGSPRNPPPARGAMTSPFPPRRGSEAPARRSRRRGGS